MLAARLLEPSRCARGAETARQLIRPKAGTGPQRVVSDGSGRHVHGLARLNSPAEASTIEREMESDGVHGGRFAVGAAPRPEVAAQSLEEEFTAWSKQVADAYLDSVWQGQSAAHGRLWSMPVGCSGLAMGLMADGGAWAVDRSRSATPA